MTHGRLHHSRILRPIIIACLVVFSWGALADTLHVGHHQAVEARLAELADAFPEVAFMTIGVGGGLAVGLSIGAGLEARNKEKEP